MIIFVFFRIPVFYVTRTIYFLVLFLMQAWQSEPESDNNRSLVLGTMPIKECRVRNGKWKVHHQTMNFYANIHFSYVFCIHVTCSFSLYIYICMVIEYYKQNLTNYWIIYLLNISQQTIIILYFNITFKLRKDPQIIANPSMDTRKHLYLFKSSCPKFSKFSKIHLSKCFTNRSGCQNIQTTETQFATQLHSTILLKDKMIEFSQFHPSQIVRSPIHNTSIFSIYTTRRDEHLLIKAREKKERKVSVSDPKQG